MKILVCGSSGLVGSDLCSLLQKKSVEYVGIYNTRQAANSYKINILDAKELNNFLDREQPTVCINCIADRNVDTCETNWEQTKKINTDIPAALAKACSLRDIFFIHISTDYVFDGRNPPYLPTDEVNPLQNYGITKFLAECRIKSILHDYCIVRVPVLYTNTYTNLSDTAVTVLAKKVMNQVENTKEDNYSVRRPVFIPDFCHFLLDCIEAQKRGTYHFYNDVDKTTKYQMCETISKYLHTSISHITAVNDPPSNDASRPYDTNFMDEQYDRAFYPTTTIVDGIQRSLEKYRYPSIYDPSSYDKLFFLLDLDGTLVDTDKLHYECYAKAFQMSNMNLDYNTYKYFGNVDKGLQYLLQNEEAFYDIKKKKREILHSVENIQMIPGAEDFIRHLTNSNIQFVVVTNTGHETVEHFKKICPALQCVKNWIVREDYIEPKPSSECFQVAINRFYKNQPYIVGIENNISGLQSLKGVTDRIYIITQKDNHEYEFLKKQDCYLIKDLTSL